MRCYSDTSFLCALYREQTNSVLADRAFEALKEPLAVSSFLLLEFRQSVRFQSGLHRTDRNKGFSREEGDQMLADLQTDLDTGALEVVAVDWPKVYGIVERLSAKRTEEGLHRLCDMIHVATALYLDSKEFLTFDVNQKKLAKAEGLKVVW